MSNPTALTTYKKQEGILGVTKDRKVLEWTPTKGAQDGEPSLVINVLSITNLQKTPVTNPKIMLKIFTQTAGQTATTTHVFTFISPSNARSEADTIQTAVSAAIAANKAIENATEKSNAGSSAAMAIASAIAGSKSQNAWDNDEHLKTDVALQQSLFKADPALQKTFMESLRTKPEAISTSQFTSQFWSTRIQLLRAHAIDKSQSRGSYNVLSVLKPSGSAGTMNVARDQIQLIFNQHPLVKTAYDREVPKPLREEEFWSRFFQSRLLKKLRGEKIDPSDSVDKYLDKYLNEDEFAGRSRAYDASIPRIIDLEGNEENHSQRKGNAPEISLRPRALDKVPIIRTLNSLSEKIMAHVAPSDVDPSQPIGMDETTYNNLLLKDLQGDPEQHKMILKVRDQSHFFADGSGAINGVEDVLARSRKDPEATIASVSKGFQAKFPQPGSGVLHSTAEPGEVEEPTMDVDGAVDPVRQATSHIFELLRQHRLQTEPIPASSGLSTTIYDRVILTHATTTEFLHQFWSAFLSGKPERVNEITSLVESLNRAMDRIKAVADDAEEERSGEIKRAQKAAEERARKTGRKSRIDYSAIGGGAAVVKELLEPTANALATATSRYKQAMAEQMAEDG